MKNRATLSRRLHTEQLPVPHASVGYRRRNAWFYYFIHIKLKQQTVRLSRRTLTDPPYLVGFRDRSGRTIAGDKTDEWLQPACNEMFRVLKKDALMVSFYGWNRVDRFMAAWKNAGFSVVGHLVFTKNYTSKAAYVGYRHECAYILAKGRPRLPQNPLPDVLGWKYSGNRHHPTEKPVTSLQPLIESFTHPNAIVLDPFAGSGSTCVAALQSGRRYIGIELLEQYHRAGQQRLAAVQRAMQQGAANDNWFMPEAA